jgi:hypothetical protein
MGRLNEERVVQRMKSVTLLEFQPGNADFPDGPPISIMTIEHGGEVEEPLMLSMQDTKTLLAKAVGVLATHGDEFCRYLARTYFTPDGHNVEDNDANAG